MIRLNLGCGSMRLPGFINIDADFSHNPDVVCDVSDLDDINIQDGIVEEILAYDVIEHFNRARAIEVLGHWRKKLVPDIGRLLLRTNDLDRLVRLYACGRFLNISTGVDFEKFAWHLFAEHEKNPLMGHYWGYNRESIIKALETAGFKEIELLSESVLVAGLYPYATCADNTNLVAIAK